MLKVLLVLGAGLLCGCQNAPEVPGGQALPSATPLTAAAEQRADWYTYFAPDGTFSVQFPKAPEQVGAKNGNLMVAHPLDKAGSNLSLVQTPASPGFTLEQLTRDPSKAFGKNVKVEKFTAGQTQGRDSADLEVVTGPNRLFIRMILDGKTLYQLIAFQAPGSTQDYSSERQQFWASFQFTQNPRQ